MFFGRLIRSQINPVIAATSEETMTAILEASIKCGESPKANSVIKIDMVNPIPPNMPTPKMCFHSKSLGLVDIFKATAKNANKKIPTGFPNINPKKIPKLSFVNKSSAKEAVLMVMAVLASAKMGSMINDTGLWRKLWSRWEVVFSPPFWNGMTNANSMPVMVAWTPECSIQYHMAAPPMR